LQKAASGLVFQRRLLQIAGGFFVPAVGDSFFGTAKKQDLCLPDEAGVYLGRRSEQYRQAGNF